MDRGHQSTSGRQLVPRGATEIAQPRLIDEIERAVGETAPDKTGDRIDHQPKAILRLLDLVERLFQLFVGGRQFAGSLGDSPFERLRDPLLLSRASSLLQSDSGLVGGDS